MSDLAFTWQMTGDLDAARQAFEEAIDVVRKTGNLRANMMGVYYLGQLTMNRGRLRQAAQLYHQGIQWCRRTDPLAVSVAWPYVGLGKLCYEWNDLADAFDYLQQALELARQGGETKILVYANLTLAHLYQTQNEGNNAWETLQIAEEVALRSNIAALNEEVAVVRARLWLRQDQAAALATWVKTRGFRFDRRQPESFENDILISLALARSQAQPNRPLPDGVVALLEQRCQTMQARCQAWTQVRNLILLAMAYQVRDQLKEATDTVEQALHLAQPMELVRTFIDEGPALAALLHRLSGRDKTADIAGRLLAAFDEDAHPPNPSPQQETGQVQPLVEPLRRREIEVLRHIADGYSNKEIAAEMIIAISTVKWHIKNIYEILQVNRRTQAVAKAKELNLL